MTHLLAVLLELKGQVFSVDVPQNSCRCIYDAALNLQPEYKHELDLLDVIENEAYSDSINHKSAFILSGGIDSSLTARVASQLQLSLHPRGFS